MKKQAEQLTYKDLIPGKLYWWKSFGDEKHKILFMFIKNEITYMDSFQRNDDKLIVKITYLIATKDNVSIKKYRDSGAFLNKEHCFELAIKE